MDAPQVAVVGFGGIGRSWARLFASHGSRVLVSDPRDDLAELVEAVSATLPAGTGVVTPVQSAAEAVADAAFVQESGPERRDAKAELFAEVGRAAPGDAILLSSSTAITATLFAEDLPEDVAARTLIGHPFNPPHIMPLVEVVPGERTSADSVDRAMEFYRFYDRAPVRLKKEVTGFAANRIQNVVVREASYLVDQGVVDAADLDTLMKNSLGLRWAAVGPFEAMHLASDTGFRGTMEHIWPSMNKIDIGDPDMTVDGIAPVIDQVEQAYGTSTAERAAERDRIQTAILKLRGMGTDAADRDDA